MVGFCSVYLVAVNLSLGSLLTMLTLPVEAMLHSQDPVDLLILDKMEVWSVLPKTD